MKIRSNVKAGASINHNQTITPGFKVKSGVKAAGLSANHNQATVRGLKVKSDVKAGGLTGNHNQSMTRSIKAVRSNANTSLLPAI